MNFFDELNKIISPEQLAGTQNWNYHYGANHYIHHPAKSITLIVEPQGPSGPHTEVHYVINQAISYLSKGNTHFQKVIDSDTKCVGCSTAEYIIRYMAASYGSKEASSRVSRLHKVFSQISAGDGCVNYKEVLDAMEEFTKEGNPFKVIEDSSKWNPNPSAMLSRVNQLKHKYENAIANGKLKRTMAAVAFSIATVGLVILFALKGPLAGMCGPILMSFKGATDEMEAAQKAKEEAMKEKSKGVAKLKQVGLEFKGYQESKEIVSHAYERFLEFIEKMSSNIKSRMESESDIGHEGGLSMRKLAMDVTEKAKGVMEEVDELEKNRKKVSDLANSMETDASDVMEDFEKGYSDTSKKVGIFGMFLKKKKKKDF